MPPASDEELIREFVDERSEDAFSKLYRRHSPAVYGVVYRLTGGRASDASDVLQNTWIRAATNLAAFRGASQFRTWLTGIALNCYREWRRALPRTEHDDEMTITRAAPVDDRRVDIDEVLCELPAPYREVIVLHDVEGYRHREIAAALGIELGTSKSRLSRARQIFRARWRSGESRSR